MAIQKVRILIPLPESKYGPIRLLSSILNYITVSICAHISRKAPTPCRSFTEVGRSQ